MVQVQGQRFVFINAVVFTYPKLVSGKGLESAFCQREAALHGGPAAVDVQVLAGDVGAGVRGEEDECAAELERAAYAV